MDRGILWEFGGFFMVGWWAEHEIIVFVSIILIGVESSVRFFWVPVLEKEL